MQKCNFPISFVFYEHVHEIFFLRNVSDYFTCDIELGPKFWIKVASTKNTLGKFTLEGIFFLNISIFIFFGFLVFLFYLPVCFHLCLSDPIWYLTITYLSIVIKNQKSNHLILWKIC